ncbi:hypothetical protein, partial [Endobacter medicaginis]
ARALRDDAAAMSRAPRPPGHQPSLIPWLWVCAGLVVVLVVVQYVLPHHAAGNIACQLGDHSRC